jgi:hypothetical protein
MPEQTAAFYRAEANYLDRGYDQPECKCDAGECPWCCEEPLILERGDREVCCRMCRYGWTRSLTHIVVMAPAHHRCEPCDLAYNLIEQFTELLLWGA